MSPKTSFPVLAAWLALAWCTKSLEIPPAIGTYNVGATKQIISVDCRNGSVTQNVTDSFLVTLFYPTLQEPDIPGTSPYLTPGTAKIFEEWLQAPNGTLARLTDRVIWEAPFAENLGHGHDFVSPTLLFQSGLGGPSCECYTIMLSSLASQGYTIAAIDQPYEQPYVLYPDGREFYGPPVTYNWTYDDAVVTIANRTRDTLALIDAWPALSKELKIKSSTHRFGTFGHSIGGMTALTVAQMVNQSVIPSGINLDGAFLDGATKLALNSSAADIKRPCLLVGSEPHTIADPSWVTYPKSQSSWVRWINILGSEHLDFSDATFWKTLIPGVDVPETGNISASRMIEITNAFISDFFNWTLLGKDEGELFNKPADVFPETELILGLNLA